MAIKKLKNNFTTPEQSKRLLALGVPADSADCYYVTRNNYTAILHNELYTKCRDEMIKVSKTAYRVKMHDDDVLPCWSVGRLIEIFSKCYTGAKCYYSPRNLYKTEFWIERFERLSKIGFIDFSKLEEYSERR